MEKSLPAFDRLEEVSLEKVDGLLQSMASDIGPGNIQGLRGKIGRPDLCITSLLGEAHSDSATAGSKIKNLESRMFIPLSHESEGYLHQKLGLRSWHKHNRRYEKIKRPEFPLPGDVGDRFPSGAPLKQILEQIFVTGLQGYLVVEVKFFPPTSYNLAQEHLRIASSTLNTHVRQKPCPLLQGLPNCQGIGFTNFRCLKISTHHSQLVTIFTLIRR